MHQQILNELFENIQIFLASSNRCQWIYLDEIKIYVRKSKRYHNYKMYDCFDIAAIEVKNPGKGLFTAFLKRFLISYPETNIFVESILNEKLKPFLNKKFGFEYFRIDDMILIR